MEALARGGPVHPRALVVVGSYFLLREIEAAAFKFKHVTLDHGLKTATLTLSASKNDPQTWGCTRTWGCVCNDDAASVCNDDAAAKWTCPFHAALDHITISMERYGRDPERTFFHTSSGHTPTKAAVIATIVRA
eukprot:3624036-Amphidinium_carterae.1